MTTQISMLDSPVPAGELVLRPYQAWSVDELARAKRDGHLWTILCAPTGSGKCHPAGTRVMTVHGYPLRVESVVPGMALMGPDSQPRYVRSVSRSHGPIVEVVPVKGEPWHCNLDHILTLVRTPDGQSNRGGEVVDVSVREWMRWSDYRKHLYKLFRVGVDFSTALPQSLTVDPYLVGLLLGDGSLTRGVTGICTPDPEIIEYCRKAAVAWGLVLRDTTSRDRAPDFIFSQGQSGGAKNPLTDALRQLGVHGDDAHSKHVPDAYRVASRQNRLKLLAGLMDTDGHLSNGYFDYISASRELAEDVAFVARSVGLAAYVKQCEKGIASTGFRGTYHRVSISGDVDMIPTRVTRKQAQPRQQKKDVLRTGFDIHPVGDDHYYGFTLTGDGRYLLGDFTVTHNTEIAIHLIDRARKRGMRIALVCDRRTLVKQTSDRFFQYGIPHGVAMAEKTFGRSMPIQICSVQTIQKRGYWPALDLLVIDEAHTQHKGVLEFAKNWGGPVIGLTATPLTEGLGQWYSKVINAVTTDRLLADGYLAPLKIYAATEIDMAGAKKGNDGEWLRSEVHTRGHKIVGDIVSTYERMTRQHFGGPVKTLMFSADIAHGEELCRAFQAAGHDFRQSTYRDSDDDTERLVEGFRQGAFTGLVSVEKFVKGFDVPDVLCMIGARPYSSSLASVIQQMGRGMRTAEGKEFCLYLDHAGNVAGWYDDVMEFWANGVDRLDTAEKRKPKRREGEDRPDVVCDCGYVLQPGMQSCPSCGAARRRRRTKAEVVPGRMEKWATSQSAEWMKDESWVWSQLCRLALERTNGDSNAAQGKAAGYYKGMYSRFPKWGRPLKPCDGPVDERVSKRVQHNLIRYRYAKSRRST